MSKNQFELLAPGGDIESIKAAILAGAGAIYCGLDNFNARNRAKNLSFEQLNGVIRLAHQHECQVFLTLNIIILEHEFSALIRLLNKLVNTHLDAVIVQDIGLFYLLARYFPSLDVHASTQVTTHNIGQLAFFKKLEVSRVNLSRELNIKEIKTLTQHGHKLDVLSEVFVHGSYCVGFSGLCYMSSAHGGNSGNRGRCSQPCRDQSEVTEQGNDFPLNLKDNSAYFDLPALIDAGVDSLKIEGRIKDFHYVYTVVNAWRQQLDGFINEQQLQVDDSALYKVFNRDLSNGYLAAELHKNMFIDNPRNHSLSHFSKLNNSKTLGEIQQVKQSLYDEKTLEMQQIRSQLAELSIDKQPLTLIVKGQESQHLKLELNTTEGRIELGSDSLLISADKYVLDEPALVKRLKNINSPDYFIETIDLSGLDEHLFIPFKELGKLKEQIVYFLNGNKTPIAPVVLPMLQQPKNAVAGKVKLKVLIDSKRDLPLCEQSSAEFYYKLPDSLGKKADHLIRMFTANKHLLPWFPSILIGDDYQAALELLEVVRPQRIVTNNTGIAFQAHRLGIEWIAGPLLNITNSYSLLAMQKEFNCSGSFISNEINKAQMKHIKRPEHFELMYSLYHPIMLLSSRQCLFHQTVGCKKSLMDEDCLPKCKKSTSLINLKGNSFTIDKQVGRHTCMYNDQDFLNLDIINDLPELFDSYFIDLTRVHTPARTGLDNEQVLALFEALLAGDCEARAKLQTLLPLSTNQQYKKGL